MGRGKMNDLLCSKCYFYEKMKKYRVKCHRTGNVFNLWAAPRNIDQCPFFEPVWNHKSFLFLERKYFNKRWIT